MKKAKLLAILILVLVLAVTAYIVTAMISASVKEEDSRAEEESNRTYTLFASEKTDITGISYTYTDEDGKSEQLSFVLEDEKWMWKDHPTVPLSKTAMTALAANVIGISGSYKLDADDASLAAYGLDSPARTLTFTEKTEGDVRVLVGKYNTAKGMYYIALEGAPYTVYLIDKALIDAFNLPLTELVDCDVLPNVDKDALISLSYRKEGADDRMFRYYKDGSDTDYTSLYNWYFSVGGAAPAALEETYASKLTTELTSLSFGSCVYVGRDGMATYGLDQPATVTFTYLADDKENTLTLLMSKTEDSGSYYVMPEGEQIIYRMSASVFDTVFDESTAALLPRRVLNPSWSDVASVTLEPAGGDKVEITLIHGDDGKTSYRINGEDSVYKPIEPVFTALIGLKAEKDTATDTVENTPADGALLLRVTLTFTDGRHEPLVLTLTNAYESLVLASCGSRATQLVTKESADELIRLIGEVRPAAE